ncbi:hypothetical protein P691DRAFT_707922 [Macrolepiota fuliginosa MF-IS2]|uniref:Protein BCP1 n=1 Tax=Macrolepiota fuliginosa MF-IS2 TaxID=1400762 RepID=A0A9P6C2K9_9AGAR|nr:hypothetical protein P691DRAFT_707922 [Macrolepiota fuliginosa MF-IS2]
MKRKQADNADTQNDSDSGSDVSLVNVDFDFFDPNPTIDYHAINRLLKQLFQRDAELFSTTELTDLILSQPTIGTTIKTDGIESDPYALLTVLNMHAHYQHPSIKAIANYCLDKVNLVEDKAFHATLSGLFSQTQHHVGLVICERLINMPVQVIPPMYSMLADELQRSISANEPYIFSHFLFISRNYHLTPEEESALVNTVPRNRSKSKSSSPKKSRPTPSQPTPEPPADGIYPFHPEDEAIRALSLHSLDYRYSNASNEPRENDSFGLDLRARMMLLPADRFEALVQKLQEVYSAI